VTYVIEDEVKIKTIQAKKFDVKYGTAMFYVGRQVVAWISGVEAVWEAPDAE
jgi:hypothetical protein